MTVGNANEKLAAEIRLLELDAQLRETEVAAALRQAEIDNRHHELDKAALPIIGTLCADLLPGLTKQVRSWQAMPPSVRPEHLTVYLTSSGGEVFSGLAMYDLIHDSGLPIEIQVQGLAASMASVLLQAGTTRTMTPDSWLMIHESSSMLGRLTSSELRDHMEVVEQIEQRSYDILAERSHLTVEDIKRHADRKDWYLNATDALAFGFVDRVV